LRRAEGGAKIFGVFRVKNHDFTPKNRIFSNCGGRRENIWGISCEKSRFYAKKSYFFHSFYILTFLMFRKLNKPQLTKIKQQNFIGIRTFDSCLYLDSSRSFK
jgi:hypothetical protein